MEDELVQLQMLPDILDLQKEIHLLRQDVQELKSMQSSFAVDMTQWLVWHQALFITAEISRLLQKAGISTQINVPSGMYLGGTPYPTTMTLEELANQLPNLFGPMDGGSRELPGVVVSKFGSELWFEPEPP